MFGFGVCELTLPVVTLPLRFWSRVHPESSTTSAVGCTLCPASGAGDDWQEPPRRPATLWTETSQNDPAVLRPQSHILKNISLFPQLFWQPRLFPRKEERNVCTDRPRHRAVYRAARGLEACHPTHPTVSLFNIFLQRVLISLHTLRYRNRPYQPLYSLRSDVSRHWQKTYSCWTMQKVPCTEMYEASLHCKMCSLDRASFRHCTWQAGAFCQKGVQLAVPLTVSAVLSRNAELLDDTKLRGYRSCTQEMATDHHENKKSGSSKDKLEAKWVSLKRVGEWGRDKHYPSSWGCLYNQGRPQLLFLISRAMEEGSLGARFHLSDSHRLGKRLRGSAGMRDQRQRVVSPLMLEPALLWWSAWARKRIFVTDNTSILHRWRGTDICHCRERRKHHRLRLPMCMCWQYWEQEQTLHMWHCTFHPKVSKRFANPTLLN